MISKEEYIELYCNEESYYNLDVVLHDINKIAERMRIDPIKTLQDLDDYGLNDAMQQNGIEAVYLINPRTREKQKITKDTTSTQIRSRTPLLDKLLED